MAETSTNISILEDTLRILKQGWYEKDGKRVTLKLSPAEMQEIKVFLPEDLEKVCNDPDFQPPFTDESVHCTHGYKNRDSFNMARTRAAEGREKLLVLNFADPMQPGGDVRSGIECQEADLCRASSLLLSLESDAAQKYYLYHRELQDRMYSDSIMLTPRVEIIRDENGELLDDTVVVSVISCSAPEINGTGFYWAVKPYCDILYQRVLSMMRFSAYFGYKNLIFGAWGCGGCGNNSNFVADMFSRATHRVYNGRSEHDLFEHIDFAVLDKTEERYNLKQFKRDFMEPYFEREKY